MNYAEQQLDRAKQLRQCGRESAAKDAACRAISNLLDLPVPDVAAAYESADEAIAAAESDVTREIIDNY